MWISPCSALISQLPVYSGRGNPSIRKFGAPSVLVRWSNILFILCKTNALGCWRTWKRTWHHKYKLWKWLQNRSFDFDRSTKNRVLHIYFFLYYFCFFFLYFNPNSGLLQVSNALTTNASIKLITGKPVHRIIVAEMSVGFFWVFRIPHRPIPKAERCSCGAAIVVFFWAPCTNRWWRTPNGRSLELVPHKNRFVSPVLGYLHTRLFMRTVLLRSYVAEQREWSLSSVWVVTS